MVQVFAISRAAQFVDQRERGAGEIIGGAPAAAQALREAGFARAQLAFQADDFAACQQLT